MNSLINESSTIKITNTEKLDLFIKEMLVKKKEETHHKSDSFNQAYRLRTGMGGEMALEQFLGKNFVDLTIGDSNDYHVPDLSKIGLNVGIKTVELGKYPVIFKKSERPEIIVLRLSDEVYSIIGLVTTKDLNSYQDDSKILSPSLKARGTKTAFVGLNKIKPFSNYEELIELLNIC
jgi:hypothetical protein